MKPCLGQGQDIHINFVSPLGMSHGPCPPSTVLGVQWLWRQCYHFRTLCHQLLSPSRVHPYHTFTISSEVGKVCPAGWPGLPSPGVNNVFLKLICVHVHPVCVCIYAKTAESSSYDQEQRIHKVWNVSLKKRGGDSKSRGNVSIDWKTVNKKLFCSKSKIRHIPWVVSEQRTIHEWEDAGTQLKFRALWTSLKDWQPLSENTCLMGLAIGCLPLASTGMHVTGWDPTVC